PGTDGSSRSQYSAVYITSIDGLMPPDLLTNGSDYANSLLYGVLAQHRCRLYSSRCEIQREIRDISVLCFI
ncbi:MAG TPA: hypothetical protein VHZ55_19055, partial [Bryobacteraceae bacterium]|nr:hypothetical protein [Bryobacteraceae bacterium]